jgi:hypothetical protein
MLAWFGELNAGERRTMGACFGGWALDAFDVQMYSFVIPTVIALWGVSRGEAGLIGTVTLLISSLGGWFSGTLADRFGRVRMLQITILCIRYSPFSAPSPRILSSSSYCAVCQPDPAARRHDRPLQRFRLRHHGGDASAVAGNPRAESRKPGGGAGKLIGRAPMSGNRPRCSRPVVSDRPSRTLMFWIACPKRLGQKDSFCAR